MSKGWSSDRMEKWDWWTAFGAMKTGYRPRLCPTFLWWQRNLWMSLEFISNRRVLNWIVLPEVPSFWLFSFLIFSACHTIQGIFMNQLHELKPTFHVKPNSNIFWDFPRVPLSFKQVWLLLITWPLSYCSPLPSMSSVDCKLLMDRDWGLSLYSMHAASNS